jgi:hypothetical protein
MTSSAVVTSAGAPPGSGDGPQVVEIADLPAAFPEGIETLAPGMAGPAQRKATGPGIIDGREERTNARSVVPLKERLLEEDVAKCVRRNVVREQLLEVLASFL